MEDERSEYATNGGRDDPVDQDEMVANASRRVLRALQDHYEYPPIQYRSDDFLRKNVLKRFYSVVLYVDLVGSTELVLNLHKESMAAIMGSFVQEMAHVVSTHRGLVLKFIGDAVIGYFPATDDSLLAADRAVGCARSMLRVIQDGVNPVLVQYDYPELRVRIGMDYGENIVMRYGRDPQKSHVDMLGRSMNMASKIQSAARPDQILVGEHVYVRLRPPVEKKFKLVVWKDRVWSYHATDTGNIYKVYACKG